MNGTIRILSPRFDQVTYEDRALNLGPPHGPDCPCLMDSDARAATGHVPLESEWAQRARLMRERDALLRAADEDEPGAGALLTLLAFAAVALLAFGFWFGVLRLIERFVR
jgi:hypothetical protein